MSPHEQSEMPEKTTKVRNIAQYIAISFGTFLIFGETLRNWGEWPHWSGYAFDYLFAVLLIVLGLAVRRTRYVALSMMVPIWSLTILLFTWSLLGHIKNLDEPTYGLISQVPLTISIGVLDLVAVAGVFFTIVALVKTKSQGRSSVS